MLLLLEYLQPHQETAGPQGYLRLQERQPLLLHLAAELLHLLQECLGV